MKLEMIIVSLAISITVGFWWWPSDEERLYSLHSSYKSYSDYIKPFKDRYKKNRTGRNKQLYRYAKQLCGRGGQLKLACNWHKRRLETSWITVYGIVSPKEEWHEGIHPIMGRDTVLVNLDRNYTGIRCIDNNTKQEWYIWIK